MAEERKARERQVEIVVVPDAEALAREAAERVARAAGEAIARAGRFTVALSGGSTPRALYRLLAQPPYRDRIDWRRVHVFWGDERTVPPDHPDSNYRMAREALLDRVPIPHDQIHPMRGDLEPRDAAAQYADLLTRFFDLDPGEEPDFDLILLGVGADGHTASLFPGTRALDDLDDLVVENVVPQLQTTRVTLTIPVLLAARRILVLVAGEDKAEAVRRALEAPYDPTQTPSQVLRTAAGPVTWLLDEAAAGRLSRRPGR